MTRFVLAICVPWALLFACAVEDGDGDTVAAESPSSGGQVNVVWCCTPWSCAGGSKSAECGWNINQGTCKNGNVKWYCPQDEDFSCSTCMLSREQP
jgi:hypothetical protein